MSRAGLRQLIAMLEQELPRLRACAAALTADRTGDLRDADALLAHVLERVVTAWPRCARRPDPVAAVAEALVRRAVRDAPAVLADRGVPAAHETLDPPLDGPLRVLAALAGLPVRQRALLVLRDLSGVPVERAATVLGLPVPVAEAEHRTAVAALGRALGEDLADPVPQGAQDPPGGAGALSAVAVVDLSAPDGAA